MQHGTLVLIKERQTVLRYYSLVNCIHAKKLTVLHKSFNPSINVTTIENTHYNIVLNDLIEVVLRKWQDVWSNGKIAVHRSRKHTGKLLLKTLSESD